jgi:hypothetical protein
VAGRDRDRGCDAGAFLCLLGGVGVAKPGRSVVIGGWEVGGYDEIIAGRETARG